MALVVMLLIIAALFMGLFFILGLSISRFSERVGFYASQLNSQLVDLDALLKRLGLSSVDLRDVVKPGGHGAFGEGGHLTIDEKALGVGVAAVALALRAPVLLAVVLAALVTAFARLLLG